MGDERGTNRPTRTSEPPNLRTTERFHIRDRVLNLNSHFHIVSGDRRFTNRFTRRFTTEGSWRRGSRSGAPENPQSAIRNPQSDIPDPPGHIPHPTSDIRTLFVSETAKSQPTTCSREQLPAWTRRGKTRQPCEGCGMEKISGVGNGFARIRPAIASAAVHSACLKSYPVRTQGSRAELQALCC